MHRGHLRSLAGVLLVVVPVAAGAACTSFSSDDPPSEADGGDARVLEEASIGDGGVEADAPAEGSRPVSEAGCSDGTREAFRAAAATAIAGCQGAWGIGGLLWDAGPRCGRGGGDQGTHVDGIGCAAEDLCADGWHVCRDGADVLARGGALPGEICLSIPKDSGVTFFATAQPSAGAAVCIADAGAVNDVFGCGDIPSPINSCGPLNTVLSTFVPTTPLPDFDLGGDNDRERANVKKGPGPGGVLCCRD
jgi:hypothetical protein